MADFKPLNVALKRPVWGSESSDQLIRHISPNAKYFCTADAISGYYQIPVNPEHQFLTSFLLGLLKYGDTRGMPASPAEEYLQNPKSVTYPPQDCPINYPTLRYSF